MNPAYVGLFSDGGQGAGSKTDTITVQNRSSFPVFDELKNLKEYILIKMAENQLL